MESSSRDKGIIIDAVKKEEVLGHTPCWNRHDKGEFHNLIQEMKLRDRMLGNEINELRFASFFCLSFFYVVSGEPSFLVM